MVQNNDNSGVIVGIVLIVILLAILFGTAWGQSLRSSIGLGDGATATSTRVNTNDSMRDTSNNTNNNPTNTTNTTITSTTTSTTTVNTAMNPTDVAFRVQMSSLSPEQQAMLRTAGISGSEIAITNEMKTCAEQSIGAGRTAEIAGGAKPSIIESGKLIVCYNR